MHVIGHDHDGKDATNNPWDGGPSTRALSLPLRRGGRGGEGGKAARCSRPMQTAVELPPENSGFGTSTGQSERYRKMLSIVSPSVVYPADERSLFLVRG
jgi:hypothetical protein